MRDLQRSVASYAHMGVECGEFRAPSALDPAACACERGNYEADLAAVQLRTFDLENTVLNIYAVARGAAALPAVDRSAYLGLMGFTNNQLITEHRAALSV
ncbi:hypothetical protein AOLI_G00141120 [Acnodon oligacanthus]